MTTDNPLKNGFLTSEFFSFACFMATVAANGAGLISVPWDFMWAVLGANGIYTAKRGGIKIAAVLKAGGTSTGINMVKALIAEARKGGEKKDG